MKRLVFLGTVLCVLAAHSANAQVSVIIGQPVYYTPPIYAVGYWEDYNRYPHYKGRGRGRDNWSYWAKKHRQEHEGHDNGNHGEGNRGNGYGNHR